MLEHLLRDRHYGSVEVNRRSPCPQEAYSDWIWPFFIDINKKAEMKTGELRVKLQTIRNTTK